MGTADKARSPPKGATARRRWAWFALSLVTLSLSLWGAFLQRTHGMLPPEHGPETLTYPREVRGHVVESAGELEILAQTWPPGDVLDLGPPAGAVALVHEIDVALLVLTLVSALSFWAVCAFVLAPRAAPPGPARDLFVCMALSGLGIGIGGIYPPLMRGEVVLGVLYVVNLAFMPVVFLRFTLTFPRRSPLLDRVPHLMGVPLLLALGATVWAAATWLPHFAMLTPSSWAATRPPEHVLQAILVLGMGAGCVILFHTARHADLERERNQTKWLLWGITIAATPFVFLRMLPRLVFDDEVPLSPAVDRFVELTMPASFAIAVAKHKLFDIDVIIRRSLLCTALAVVLTAAFLPAALLLGHYVTLPEAIPQEFVLALAGAVPAALFLPARRILSKWVDRTFFKIRHTHGQALKSLDAPLAHAADQGEVAAVLRRFLEDSLQPKTCAVVVVGAAGRYVDGNVDAEAARRAPDLVTGFAVEQGIVVAQPDTTAVPEVESQDFAPELIAAGVHVVQPVTREGRLLGLMLCGEKGSERRYVEEDFALLSAAAARAAVAIERISLVQTVAEESMGRRALADLNRQKTDFLLRVAHDLRTPLTAVRWSTDNLLDGLSGPITDQQAEDLTGMKAASGQLGRLIDNLLAISRLELGAAPKAAEPVDLAAVTREAMTALKPQAGGKSVRIDLTVAPNLPPAQGRKDALFQVAMNLMDNAVKYSPPGTAVEVGIGLEGPGVQTFTVRDRGPGLPAEGADRLFELFRQGDASPHSTAKGFGVGLYIVRSWVETLDGTVSAGNHPEGGAVFTCRLKCWEPAGGSR